MRTYFALVHHDPGSAWGISFPDLPGCFAAADEEADIFAMAQEALSLYAEGEPQLPAARRIEELLDDPEIKSELKGGAVMISLPLIVLGKKARYNVMLDAALVAGVDTAARTAGVSRSEYIAKALVERLNTDLGSTIHSPGSGGRYARFPKSSKEAKSAAASMLTQSKSKEVDSSRAASAAGRMLKDPKASKEAKSAAASALTQKKDGHPPLKTADRKRSA